MVKEVIKVIKDGNSYKVEFGDLDDVSLYRVCEEVFKAIAKKEEEIGAVMRVLYLKTGNPNVLINEYGKKK